MDKVEIHSAHQRFKKNNDDSIICCSLIFGIEHNYSDSFQYAKTLVDDGSYTI
jgi:hypothetical protein